MRLQFVPFLALAALHPPCAWAQSESKAPPPLGVTWDGSALWTIDPAGKLRKLDGSGKEVQVLESGVKAPRAIAFDGTRFWIADQAERTIGAFEPASGKVVRTIPLPIPAEKGFKSVEGLAWDGKYLWAAYYAGFSSSLNQIDPADGRLLRSVFADCHPRGLASNGGRLWILCLAANGAYAVIDQRPILDREHEMLKARVFLSRVDVRDSGGLAFDGTDLVVFDRAAEKLLRFPLGKPR